MTLTNSIPVRDPPKYIELLNAFVSPEAFRGQGVGTKLLEAITMLVKKRIK